MYFVSVSSSSRVKKISKNRIEPLRETKDVQDELGDFSRIREDKVERGEGEEEDEGEGDNIIAAGTGGKKGVSTLISR